MPRKDRDNYREYMREYMAARRQGLTGINSRINKSPKENETKLVVGGTVQ